MQFKQISSNSNTVYLLILVTTFLFSLNSCKTNNLIENFKCSPDRSLEGIFFTYKLNSSIQSKYKLNLYFSKDGKKLQNILSTIGDIGINVKRGNKIVFWDIFKDVDGIDSVFFVIKATPLVNDAKLKEVILKSDYLPLNLYIKDRKLIADSIINISKWKIAEYDGTSNTFVKGEDRNNLFFIDLFDLLGISSKDSSTFFQVDKNCLLIKTIGLNKAIASEKIDYTVNRINRTIGELSLPLNRLHSTFFNGKKNYYYISFDTLYLLNDNKWKSVQIDSSKRIINVFKDLKSNYWIIIDKIGVIKYDGMQLSRIENVNFNINDIRGIYCDSRNTSWIIGIDNLYKIDGNKVLSKELISTKDTLIYIDKKNNLWYLGTKSVSKFNGVSWNSFPNSVVKINRKIYDYLDDVNGNLWIASDDGRFSVFDGKTWRKVRVKGKVTLLEVIKKTLLFNIFYFPLRLLDYVLFENPNQIVIDKSGNLLGISYRHMNYGDNDGLLVKLDTKTMEGNVVENFANSNIELISNQNKDIVIKTNHGNFVYGTYNFGAFYNYLQDSLNVSSKPVGGYINGYKITLKIQSTKYTFYIDKSKVTDYFKGKVFYEGENIRWPYLDFQGNFWFTTKYSIIKYTPQLNH